MENKKKLQMAGWLLSEIDSYLRSATEALESYLRDPFDESRLTESYQNIHLIFGSLKLARLDEELLLAGEMERLLDLLRIGSIENISEACQALIEASTQLSYCLNQRIDYQRSNLLVLLFSINDLRAIQNEPLASSSLFFNPDLTGFKPSETTVRPVSQTAFVKLVEKLRKLYRVALQGVIKKENTQQNLGYLEKAYSRLYQIAKGTPHEPLWQSVLAINEALQEGALGLGPGIKNLLGELDQQLATLQEQGYSALQENVSESLLKNLLFYVMVGKSHGEHSSTIIKAFNLETAFADEANDAARGKADIKTLAALAVSFESEVNSVKDLLERFATSQGDDEVLDEASQIIRKLASSLDVLGFTELKEQAFRLAQDLSSLGKTGSNDEGTVALVDVANQLVAIEARLYHQFSGSDKDADRAGNRMIMDSATKSLIREVQRTLERVKDAIVDFIASNWQGEKLEGVPELLLEAIGVFQIMKHPEMTELLDSCNRYIVNELQGGVGHSLDWQKMDLLAETITSIEYYLDCLEKHQPETAEQVLSDALQKVPQLAVKPLEEETTSSVEQKVEVDQPVDAKGADPQESEHDEFTEIFVEEAEEVLADLRRLYPSWMENSESGEYLKDIRRAFHTLKGSGRMVGAQIIGELAWSVENLLNKLIDKRIVNSAPLMALVELVIEQLPTLVSLFRDHKEPANLDYIKELETTAEKLSKGEEGVIPVPESPATSDAGEAVENSEGEKAEVSESDFLPVDETIQTVHEVSQTDSNVVTPDFESSLTEAEVNQSDYEAPQSGFEVTASDYETSESGFEAVQPEYESSLSESDLSVDEEVLVDVSQVGTSPLEAEIESPPDETDNPDSANEEDESLLDIFAGETQEYLDTVKEFIDAQRRDAPLYSFPPGAVQRALHTLKGSARMAEIEPINELVTPLEQFIKELYHHQIDVNEDVVSLLEMATASIQRGVEQIRSRETVFIEDTPTILEQLVILQGSLLSYQGSQEAPTDQAVSRVDPSLLNQLMQNDLEQLLDADQLLEQWKTTGENGFISALESELASLNEAALAGGVQPLAEIAQLLLHAWQHIRVAELPADEDLINTLELGHEVLISFIDTFVASQDIQPLADDLRHALVEITSREKPGRLEGLKFTHRPIEPIQVFNSGEIDPDILETFLQEADELSSELDERLNNWQHSHDDVEQVEAIKRVLHTLKGGARMAGLSQIGKMGHELESDVQELQGQLQLLDPEIFDYLFKQQDNLNKALAASAKFLQEIHSAQEIEVPVVEELPEEEPEASESLLDENFDEEESAVEAADSSDDKLVLAPVIERKTAGQEMVRVAAGVLEKLVNLAGESSISRGRIEQQVSEFHGLLSDMEDTIRRLQGQVRLLGIETEAQIMFRREQLEASASFEGFDPLEMDRYSQLQQLSKSLLESSSDLLDLKTTLLNTTRDAEVQLVQQTRIQSDLQEALMRARMVSFSTVVPRLRRIVRQLSNELGKQVKLEFTSIDGEMDRSVLEKMVAPLEHMIRNAIDHGLESTEKRQALGKPEHGSITIGMVRRGGEVHIELIDDGQGLNIEAIRKKAIDRNLMSPDANLSDHEVAQFIFQTGFSTRDSLSEVSGRGVGMDVVFSQVRQLGGSVDLKNNPGKGLEFKVKLPFTVSVNRALMVRIKDDLYALPLNSIGGLINIAPKQLESLYRHPEKRLEYGNQQYQVRYLGGMLTEGLAPKIDYESPYSYLVLIDTENSHYAVHVDALLTSQEVVVKSLGEQFSHVAGLSGATILSDGRVVVILDLQELLLTQSALSYAPLEVSFTEDRDSSAQKESVQTVMVVDDSVTVRKVTSRFLHREGFNVLTAKDGLEAMQLLQEHTPDLMLLDIEMPGMDGFEVASRIKTSNTWKRIPIIMVTSRTGEKHRKRATEIGVEGYVGKPYQEDELLELMNELMAMAVG